MKHTTFALLLLVAITFISITVNAWINSTRMTAKWMGKEDRVRCAATIPPDVEIGLRYDGVVVWREKK